MTIIRNHPIRTIPKWNIILDIIIASTFFLIVISILIYLICTNSNIVSNTCIILSVCFVIPLLSLPILFSFGSNGGPNVIILIILHGLKSVEIKSDNLTLKKYGNTRSFITNEILCEYKPLIKIIKISVNKKRYYYQYVEERVVDLMIKEDIKVKINNEPEKILKGLEKIFKGKN